MANEEREEEDFEEYPPSDPEISMHDLHKDIAKMRREMKKELHNMKREMREELREAKHERKQVRREFIRKTPDPLLRKKRTHRHKPYAFSYNFGDWGDRFGHTVQDWIGSVIGSVSDGLENAFETVIDIDRGPGRRRRRRTRRRRVAGVPKKDLEEFYTEGAKLITSVSDPNRLKILKALERGPLYQTDLSEKTGISGGSFKHHMDILREQDLVVQEAVRGRYLISLRGREILKLTEMLWIQKKRHSQYEEEKLGDDEEIYDIDIEDNDHTIDIDVDIDSDDVEVLDEEDEEIIVIEDEPENEHETQEG